jgi:hypothetical protein
MGKVKYLQTNVCWIRVNKLSSSRENRFVYTNYIVTKCIKTLTVAILLNAKISCSYTPYGARAGNGITPSLILNLGYWWNVRVHRQPSDVYFAGKILRYSQTMRLGVPHCLTGLTGRKINFFFLPEFKLHIF